MLAIKFKRIGKKHQPSFRIVVGEKRSKVLGRSREDLGWFDPKTKEAKISKERALYWIKVGAKPTPSIHNLLINEKIIEGKKVPVHKKSKKTEEKTASV
ncbi:30S ribosomal protein S16 [Patescibacteria group bacterium]|nr:30S ribosomal protein S16 [Patescibacteria group bacterium]